MTDTVADTYLCACRRLLNEIVELGLRGANSKGDTTCN